MTRVLLADDDRELCELLADYLSGEGFSVEAVYDGASAAAQAHPDRYDILVLDVMLPEQNGFDVLRELRARGEMPVLMLTARGDDIDRIIGLEIGADDYLVKPCNPRELAARIRAILRRSQAAPSESGAAIVVNDLTLEPGRRSVEKDGVAVVLTSTEFSVLQVLMSHAGSVIGKDELTEAALDRKLTPYDRSIDMHVSHLRKKLGPNPDGGQRIKTVRSVGYLFVR